MRHVLILALTVATLVFSPAAPDAAPVDSPLNYHQSFDNFDFLEFDFVARSGLKTKEDRGMTLETGKFGKGLMMNLTPNIFERYDYSGQYLDEVTAAMFRTGAQRKYWTSDNEPFIWGAGKVNTGSGSVAFWVKGPLSEGDLFNQSAMVWGRWERFLLAITVNDNGKVAAHMVDSRYHKHEIVSNVSWNDSAWNHVTLNWDKAKGLELFINGTSAASSWESDSWWQTALPGLMHFPMPHVTYDEFFSFSRPLSVAEINGLMTDNSPPSGGEAPARTTADRDRLAGAFGIEDSDFPVITPMSDSRVLSFKEVTPSFVGDYKIPCFFARDGRYELAWPHPLAVFTPIPGDASHQAEKLDIEVPVGTAFNYVSMEGNLTGIREAMFNPEKNADELFEGNRFFSIPDDDRFYFGTKVERKYHPRFSLPFVKGYGAPPDFKGDLHLPLTGETRVHEVSVFDVTPEDNTSVYGDMTYYLRSGGSLQYRYDFGLKTFYARDERRLFTGFRTASDEDEGWIDTGYLQRLNIVTTPMTGKECVGGIVLNLVIKTEKPDDVLIVRLRDPGSPHRIWTHAEVKLSGFEGEGETLRLLLDHPAIIMPAGDAIWLDIATLNNAKIKIGGPDGSRIVLKKAPFHESEKEYEMKGLMPVIAECTKAHYQPWLFEKIWPDLMKPHSFGGHFDSLMPALAVSRVLPYSTIARQYIALAKLPEGHVSELRNSSLIDVKRNEFDMDSIPEDVPAWAYIQHIVQNFRFNVVEWMVENQNPDGQLGEGWNDDVFMISGKYDIPLDSCDSARDMYLNFFEHSDKTDLLKDGWIQITPLDSLHAMDFHSERFQSLIYKLGDPYIFRRSLKTAWHFGKPDQTPQLYCSGLPFRFEHTTLEWYWGRNTRWSYKSPGEESIVSGLARLAANCDDIHFHRFTEAWNTMRNLGNENIVTGMIVGGWRRGTRSPHVNDRSVSVSWLEGGGEDLARWVTYADSTELNCRMYSFDPLPRKVTARLFRIDPGTYSVQLSEDNNGSPGAVISEFTTDLIRYDTISFETPPSKPVILTVKQIKKARVPSDLPDLAVASYDCERKGDTLRVLVSNVGAAKSGSVSLAVYDLDDIRLAQKTVKSIEAPIDFVEKSQWVEFKGMPRNGELNVVIDDKGKLKELFKGNNSAIVK